MPNVLLARARSGIVKVDLLTRKARLDKNGSAGGQMEVTDTNNTSRNGLDIAFGITLTITMTQLYRVISLVAGIEIAYVTATITMISAVYLLLSFRRGDKVVHSLPLILFVLVAFPAFTFVYAPARELRDIFIQLHYFLLVIASAYFFRNGQRHWRLFLIALAMSVVAMLLSIASPGLFAGMASMASARFDYLGRGSGLFLQPNLMAYNLILIMILLQFSLPRERFRLNMSVSIIFLIAIFLTGSRGGLIAACTLIFGLFVVDRRLNDTRFFIGGLVLGVAAIFVWLLSDLYTQGGLDLTLYLERVMSIFDDEITYQGSVSLRLAFQAEFLRRIEEQPLFGYGLGSVAYLLDTGYLLGAAHNQFLDLLLQFGAFGGLLALVCAWRMYRRMQDKDLGQARARAIVFMLTLALAMMSTNMIFSMQNFYILLGYILAVRSGSPRPVGRIVSAEPRALAT